MKALCLFAIISIIASIANATDEGSYCDYARETAEAQRLQLQSPQFISALGRSSTGAQNTLGFGLSESISSYLKGRLSTAIGEDQCRLYHDVNEINKHVQYDVIDLTNQTLQIEIDAINTQITQLNKLVEQENILVKAGTSTIVTVVTINSAIQKLRTQRAEDQSLLNMRILPSTLGSTSLSELLRDALIAENELQRSQIEQTKYSDWDVTLIAGLGTDSNRSIGTVPKKPFAGLNFSYNLGTSRVNHELDKATTSHAEWSRDQSLGPIHLGGMLKSQIQATRSANQESLMSYIDYRDVLNSNLIAIDKIDTIDSHKFKIQILIELATLNVETTARQFSITKMGEYLNKNFPE